MSFPVWSLYSNDVDSRNPSILLGYGNWEAIEDEFIVGRGSTYQWTGGSATHYHGLSSGYAQIACFGAGSPPNSFLDARLITGLAPWVSNARVNSSGALSGITHTDGTPLGGTTDSASNIPPFRAPYTWRRLPDYTFTKYASNPVMTPGGGWEGSTLCEPTVIFEGGTFKKWYRGNSGSNSAIGYATSTDGENYTKFAGNPVLSVAGGVAYPQVKKIGSTYYLFAVKIADSKWYRWSSSDGESWSIDNGGAAILTIPGVSICNTSVYYDPLDTPSWRALVEVFDGSSFHLRYAYSSDGLSWTLDSTNPVYVPAAGNPSEVIKVGSNFYVWTGEVVNGHWTIVLLISTNWTHWDRISTELMDHQSWEGTDISDPCILTDVTGQAHQNYLYYIGNQTSIGLAYLDMSIEAYLGQFPS